MILCCDGVRTEVDDEVIRRHERVGDLLAVDGDRDFRVVEAGIDGEIDDALVFAG